MCKSNGSSFYWVIKHRDTDEFIGLVSLDLNHDGISTEVSYQLLPMWWGYGYASEAVKKVIEYAFKELNLPKVMAETQTANTLSCKMLESVGIRFERIINRFSAERSIYCT